MEGFRICFPGFRCRELRFSAILRGCRRILIELLNVAIILFGWGSKELRWDLGSSE